jgi:hypothetical protein
METLGHDHFIDTIEPLPGEKIVWEGGASSKGIFIQLLRIASIILLFICLFGGIFAIPFILLETPEQPKQVTSSTSTEQAIPDRATNEQEPASQPQKPCPQFSVRRLVWLLAVGIPLVFSIIIVLVWQSVRNFWYVVTSERICIQSGTLSKNIVAIDLDKIISIKSLHSLLDRLFHVHAIEIVHAGGSSIPASNKIGLFNPYVMHYVPMSSNLASNLINIWLPRDNPIESQEKD